MDEAPHRESREARHCDWYGGGRWFCGREARRLCQMEVIIPSPPLLFLFGLDVTGGFAQINIQGAFPLTVIPSCAALSGGRVVVR